MASSAEPSAEPADVGLLSPVTAGTAAERLTGDAAVLDALVRAEVALVRALVETGVAPGSVGPVPDILAAVRVDPRDLALASDAAGNPVPALVDSLRAGVPAEQRTWVHHGATSQDIVDTALMLVAARVADRASAHLAELARTLAVLADRHRATPAVARTLTQQAMPTTLGFRIAGWLAGVDDARVRLRAVRLPASLGGPVGTAAAYGERGPAVLDAFARELDLEAPRVSWHTRRTPVLDLAHALGCVAAACGTIAADVLVMAQTEVGEAGEGTPGGSSSMPHKANPAQSVLVVSAARRVPGVASVLAASAVAENERPAGAWHAEWAPLRELLRLAGAAAERTSALVGRMRFDTEAMAGNLDRLLAALGRDRSWAGDQTANVDAWVDRVLERHEQVAR